MGSRKPEVKRSIRVAGALASAAIVLLFRMISAHADGPGAAAAAKQEDGKYLDKDGTPTFKVTPDGKVDYYSYAGFVRYSANCLQCHGPDGLGSTYAPALTESLKHLSYDQVVAIVASGKKNVSASENLVMPALGDNKNVMCYLDAIYVYLRGRADGAIQRGRPAQHEPKPDAYQKAEDACMG
jgi:methanol metabolism-related c-type cytochrome